MNIHPVDAWLAVRGVNSTAQLDALLADDAVFVTPFHDQALVGKKAVRLQLSGMLKLISDAEHSYLRQIIGTHDAMLEFESTLDGLKLNGVEILKWNDDCKITEVRVMLRPMNAATKARDRVEKLLLSKKQAL